MFQHNGKKKGNFNSEQVYRNMITEDNIHPPCTVYFIWGRCTKDNTSLNLY